MEFTRRSLVQTALTAGSVTAIGAAAINPPMAQADEIPFDKETDVLVLGGGIGGVLAAYEASRNGAHTILVEAASKAGGTFVISGGMLHMGALAKCASDPAGLLPQLCPSANVELASKYLESWNSVIGGTIGESGAPNLNITDNNGMAGALFDNYLYTWSGTDLEVVRRAASQPKTEIQVVDSKLITTEYQNVVTIRVQDYSDGVVSGDPIYQAEVNLYDEAALKAAYDAVQALMAFPQ